MDMAKSQKGEIENLRQMLEQNSETLQRMEVFLNELNDRLEATGEALSGKRGRNRAQFISGASRAGGDESSANGHDTLQDGECTNGTGVARERVKRDGK